MISLACMYYNYFSHITFVLLSSDNCGNALGLESGRITNSAITASSSYDAGNVGPQFVRWATPESLKAGSQTVTTFSFICYNAPNKCSELNVCRDLDPVENAALHLTKKKTLARRKSTFKSYIITVFNTVYKTSN